MPDFDKDFRPIIKQPGDNFVDSLGNRKTPMTATPDLSQGVSLDEALSQMSSALRFSDVGASITGEQMLANKRFRTFDANIADQEDFHAYGQSGWEQAINGILKGTNLAATTFAGGFAAMGGLLAAPFTGKLSTIWDNPVMNALDEWNGKMEDYLPNYYTQAERDAEWYSPTNFATTNFIFDKLVKNAGFAVGAMYSGNLANTALLKAGAALGKAASKAAAAQSFSKFTPVLKNLSRAFSAGENIAAARTLEQGISSIADIQAAASELGNIAKTTNQFSKFSEAARRTAIAGYSSMGEASFEALQTSKEYRNNLIEEYKKENGGLEPEGEDLKAIDALSNDVGRTSFFGNLAVLSVTEFQQLPKLIGSSFRTTRSSANSLLGEVGKVVKEDGIFKAVAPTTKFGKIYDKVTGIGAYVFDPKEALQEGLQYGLQVGTQNYYNKAYRTNDADFLVDAVLYGMSETVNSKEGMEGIILGGITGGLMQSRTRYAQSKQKANNTQAFLQQLNSAGEFRDSFQDRMNSINRGVILQQQEEAATILGDKLEAKDLETDQMHNYLSSRIKYGRFDMVMDDIADLKKMASTPEGLAELQAQGIGNIEDTVASFQARLNNFERVAKYTNELYKSANLRFSGELNEAGNRKYSDEIIDKMVYAAAKIADYDTRIPQVNQALADRGISTFDVLDKLMVQGKTNKTATKEALKQINEIEDQIDNLNEPRAVKDELKTALSDVIEMSARRKLFMTEYDAMVETPEDYKTPDNVIEAQFATVKQYKDVDGKKRSVPVELEVGKEYAISEPYLRNGNKLSLSPKIKILSTTLGGEYEVQLPTGEVTFLKPTQFKDLGYNITSAESTQEIDNFIRDIVSKEISKAYPELDLEGLDVINALSGLNDSAFVDRVEKILAPQIEQFKKEQKEAQEKRELLDKISPQIEKLQDEENNLSAFVPTADSSVEQEVSASDVEPNLKEASIIFSSTSSQSVENSPYVSDFVVRFNKFMNNARNFKNRSMLQAIMFTYNQQKALGLDGVIEMAWGKQAGELEGKALEMATDPKGGNVMVAFVQVDKNGKQSFIDADGNVIGEVGQPVDINKVVVSNMATADLKVGNYNRYRESQKEEAEAYLKGWEKYREQLFNSPSDKVVRFNFTISKGKPIINESSPENNSVAGTLVSEEAIAKEQVLEVNTKDTISHPDGNNYSVPSGRPYIVFGDMLQIVNNNKLNSNQAETVFSLLKELSDTLIAQAAGERVVFDVNKRIFLRNILFMNDQGAPSNNRVFIRGGNLYIGETKYDLTLLDKSKKQITDQLQTVYHTVNNKTLNEGLAKSFTEYYTEGGEVKSRTWKNYQSYLLSGKTPDGKARNVSSTPITTSVAKKTELVPYNYTRKYVILEGLELPVEKIKKAEAPKVETKETKKSETYQSASGPVDYTVENDSNGLPIVTVDKNSSTIAEVAKDKAKMDVIKQSLTTLELYDELESPEEMVEKFYTLQIRASIMNATGTEEVTPSTESLEEKPEAPNLSDGDNDEFYSRIGEGAYTPMSQYDIDAFKEWVAKNLPSMPYNFVENAILTYDGKEAFGKLEKGVAYIMKTGARGTEYHESFHFVFNGFLSSEEQQAMLEEFRNRKGSFKDRASGQTIDFSDATDLQAEERIADEFAEFRLGKLPARTLSQKIQKFFKAIIDFFKSFVTKKGMIDDLFDSIETGAFAERSFPDSLRRVSAKYSEIPGLSEQQINEMVQDITARIFSRVFSDNKSLFNPEKFTSRQLFSEVKNSNNYYSNISDAKWNALVSRTKDFLKTYRIEFDENSAITINDEDANRNEYAADSFTIDYKKSSPYAVKLLIGTLVKTAPMNQTASLSLEVPAIQKSSVNGAKLLEFNKAFATLLNHFENVKDPNTFVEKLVDLAKEKSEYVRLFTRIKGNLATGKINFEEYSNDDWRLFINMYQVFTKQKPEAIKEFIRGTTIYTGSAGQIGSQAELRQEWMSNMLVGSEKEDALVKKTRNYYTVNKGTISNIKVDNPAQMIDFLNKLGITFDRPQYDKIRNKRKFAEAVASIKKGLSSGPSTVDGLNKLDITKGLNELANLYTQVTSTATSTVILNSQGQQRQEFTESNFPSYLEYMFNSVASLTELKQKMPQLNDVFSANSQILKQGGTFFDEDGIRTAAQLKVKYIDGEENLNTQKGRSTSSLSIGDRFTTEINQNINGDYYVLIPADGSTEWMMNLGNQINFESFSDGVTGIEQSYEIFQKYLRDEINLAKDWRNRQKLALVGDKAKKLRFFNQILSPGLVSKAEAVINNDGDIDAFISENEKDINASVKAYIDGTVSELRKTLEDNNQITSNKSGKYTYKGLLSSFAKNYSLNVNSLSEDQLNNILTFVNTNYIINNIEYHKVLFGDPYQFKIKNGNLDETKRIKSFLSPRRFTFNMKEFNNKLNRDLNNAGEVALTETDYGYHEFKDYLKTFTVNDVNLVSSLSNVFKAYNNINETDASSWISPTAYREVKMKNGQWSDEAEAFHQWQMAFTRRNIPGYTYTNPALEAHDIALLKKPMPKYFIDVLKPIVSGNKFGKNNIDLVLDKFSQVPIYYSAVKGTNLESLFVKMFNEKADYIVVESGRKVGAETLYDLYKKDGSFNDEAFTESIEVPWDAYGIQVENSYDKEKLQTRGSQLTKLATLDLYSEGQAIGETEERKQVIKAAVERNKEALDNLVKEGFTSLLKKLGIKDNGDGTFKIVDNSKTAELLRQTMLANQLSINAIDSVTLDENGQFKIPLEASTNYIQIKNILYSAVNKSITSPKMSGFPGVQISAAMWENSSEGRQLVMKDEQGNWKKISKEEYEKLDDSNKSKVKFTSNALKFYEDADGKRYAEVLLPNWIKKNFPNDMTDEQIIKYLQEVDGGKILNGIGFRIPTQALSSVEIFKIKGFLPEYMGRSVVVPSEITTKAGSDFDIDKLNMYLRAIYKDADGDVRLVELKGSEEETKSFYKKVYEDTIQKELDKLSEYDNFRMTLVDILEKLESLPATDSDTILASLSEEDLKFYAGHQNMLQAIVDQANDDNILPSDYIKAQIETLDDVKGELAAKILNSNLRNNYADSMYKKALENEYYDSLEEILTLPENFKRLVSPNTDTTLKKLAQEIDRLEGVDESAVINPMLNRNYLTNLRNAFLTAKKWVGIAAVNITGNSLAQKSRVIVKNSELHLLLKHNMINLNGLEHMTLSKATDVNGNYISDKLSEYANAFVDVAKDPYILKIIYSNRIVGSFMLLERLGVDTTSSALFMNQPIIKKYIKYLDSTNSSVSAISNEKNLKYIKSFFPAGLNEIKKAKELLSDAKDLNQVLSDNIQNKDELTRMQNAMQHVVLEEMLKINDLASANFKMSQAINYDTTRFKNGDELYRKNVLSDIAKTENVFTGIDEILETSHIGQIKSALNNSTKALGEVLKFNQDEYREVLEGVLEYYAANQYVSNDKFNSVADKASASFLDYIIYTKGPSLDLKGLLVDSDSVANRVLEAKENRKDIKILDYLSVVYKQGEEVPSKTLKIKSRLENAFDENMLIGYMREMRNDSDPKIVELYNDIVKLAITQGSYRTINSFKSIVPLEDYSKLISPIINNLVVDEDVRNFGKSNWFQKNYFNDLDATVTISPTFWGGKRSNNGTVVAAGFGEEPQSFAYGEEEVYLYYSPSIVTNEDLGANYDNKNLLRISTKSIGAGSNIVVVPRIIPGTSWTEGDIDFLTGLTVSKGRYNQLKRDIGEKINEKFGYEKVVDKAGNPVFDYDDKGNPYYIYKAVNLYGDPGIAVEYNMFEEPSVFNNNTRKVDESVPVEDILRAYSKDVNLSEEDRDFGTEDLGTNDFKC